MIFCISFSVDAMKVKGYYIDLERDTIGTLFKTKFNLLTGHPDYNKIAGGVYHFVDNQKSFLEPGMCREIRFTHMESDFILLSVPNNFKHLLKVYTSKIFMDPRILGPVCIYYSTYSNSISSMGANGTITQSSYAQLVWILEKHNKRTLKITYGSATKNDLLNFFSDWEELENLLETKELSKRETIRIVEAYNLWFENQNIDSSDSVNYKI